MKKIAFIGVGVAMLLASPVFADTSASIQNVTPGATVLAKSMLTFNIVATGFVAQTYQITDDFHGTSLSLSNIDGNGKLSWTPNVSDVGVHNLTLKALDFSGDSAQTTISITVSPPPSVTVTNVSPTGNIMPGTKLSFTVSAPGFVNPQYIVGDGFSGSSVSNANIDASGNFSWTPDLSQNGTHTITIYATDSLGHGANTSVNVLVGAGPTLTIQSLSPSANVKPGQTLTFMVSAQNYVPSAFSVSDSFNGSTVGNLDITSNGSFSWMPAGGDVGVHMITVTGTVGVFGSSASTTQQIIVLNPDGTMPAGATQPAVTTTTTPGSAGTASSTLLASLQAQLASLMSQVSAQAPVGGSTGAASTGGYTFTSYLKPGSNGDEVSHLQQVLANLGFMTTPGNGNYGPATEAAVIKFQAAHNLSQLGVVGPATRAALNALGGSTSQTTTTTTSSSSATGYIFKDYMGLGEDLSDGSDVMELQRKLANLGFFTAAPTGTFGPATQAAVQKFQTAHNINPTGFVGSATINALNQ